MATETTILLSNWYKNTVELYITSRGKKVLRQMASHLNEQGMPLVNDNTDAII